MVFKGTGRLHSLENPALHLHSRSKVCGGDCDLVAELAKRSPSLRACRILALGSGSMPCSINRTPSCKIFHTTPAEPMGDAPDGGLIAQPGQQTPEHHLKVTAFPLDRSLRRL